MVFKAIIIFLIYKNVSYLYIQNELFYFPLKKKIS